MKERKKKTLLSLSSSFPSLQEKYGPKGGHSRPANAAPAKPNDANSKPIPDFDTNVGLSTRPPWTCR